MPRWRNAPEVSSRCDIASSTCPAISRAAAMSMRANAASAAANPASGASLRLSAVAFHKRSHSCSAAAGSRFTGGGEANAACPAPCPRSRPAGVGKSAVTARTLHRSGVMLGISLRNSVGKTSTSGQATSRSSRKRRSLRRDSTSHTARRCA